MIVVPTVNPGKERSPVELEKVVKKSCDILFLDIPLSRTSVLEITVFLT